MVRVEIVRTVRSSVRVLCMFCRYSRHDLKMDSVWGLKEGAEYDSRVFRRSR